MKKAKDVQIGERVWDRGTSFVVKEIHVDSIGLIRFIDTQGFLRGPYVPEEFMGVDQDCNHCESMSRCSGGVKSSNAPRQKLIVGFRGFDTLSRGGVRHPRNLPADAKAVRSFESNGCERSYK